MDTESYSQFSQIAFPVGLIHERDGNKSNVEALVPPGYVPASLYNWFATF
jgi:hypothetical protein